MIKLAVEGQSIALEDVENGQRVVIPFDKVQRLTGLLDGIVYGFECASDSVTEDRQ